jgi:pyridoxine/pyridoxamine 5'-phosphate oxidase
MAMALTRDEAIAFIRRHKYAVVSTLHASGAPQSAVVGIAVTPFCEIVLDTLSTSRKFANIARDRRVAVVVGWENEQTLQLEGVADAPEYGELDRIKQAYFEAWGEEGRQRQGWPGIAYMRIRPLWLRFSDYNLNPPRAEELTFVL